MVFDTPIETLKQHHTVHSLSDPLLHTAMLKGYMDGSLGSRTAALAAPYSDDPKNSGIPRYDQTKLNAMAKERAEAGFQLGFHAIGDRANHMALEAFQYAGVTPARRFRIEHSQVLLPADFDLYAKFGIIASMQPSHLLTDMNWAADRLDPERAKYSYAWRSMLSHHIPLAFGTDYPVESINPFRGLYAAVTRQNEAGTKTYEPQEKLTLNEALYAYTQGSAYADFREKEKGRLEPGFLADFIVLDRDVTTATTQQLLKTRVLRTIVNGETVYTAPK
jgi:predicted amidohydrolase YtcJ